MDPPGGLVAEPDEVAGPCGRRVAPAWWSVGRRERQVGQGYGT